MPTNAYSEAAASGKLFVAIAGDGDEKQYVGHVMFGAKYPCLQVFQTVVTGNHRRSRVGSLLLQSLIRFAEDHGFLSISAKVASDLTVANAFYQSEGFDLIRQKPGGKSKGRTINVRVRELNSPTLFGFRRANNTEIESLLPTIVPSGIATYAIDVNVFLDLMKNRADAASVQQLISASLTGAVQVVVADEFVEELTRANSGPEPDPVLQIALTLPRLPRIPASVLEPLLTKLGTIIFPGRDPHEKMRNRDISDLTHLASVIHHQLTGFVTGEKRILKRAEVLRKVFKIEVLGTVEFSNLTSSPGLAGASELRIGTEGDELSVREMCEDQRERVSNFLSSFGIQESERLAAIGSGAHPLQRRRLIVKTHPSNDIVGYASWEAPTKAQARNEIYLFVDEDHADSAAIASHLFWESMADATSAGPCVMILKNPPGHEVARVAAIEAGFRSPVADRGASDGLQRICLGGAVAKENWEKANSTLLSIAGLHLPNEIPLYEGPDTEITCSDHAGVQRALRLGDAERVFGTIFLLPGRCGTLVPIRRGYAEHLFSGTHQFSLLPKEQAALLTKRAYFRDPNRMGGFDVGSPLIFYESRHNDGRGCAFASAVVAQSRVLWAEALSDRALLKGVLDRETIMRRSKNGQISMITFENAAVLKMPVPLRRLRNIGAIDGANLVAPRKLNTSVMTALFSEAGSLGL